MRHTTRTWSTALGALLFAACSDTGQRVTAPAPPLAARKALEKKGHAQVVSASGDSAAIAAAVAQYRVLLGDPLNGATRDEQPAGRREINWDGVPAAFTNTDTFPGDFFNVRSPRGVLFTTGGTGFRVSDNGFSDVNAAYTGEFNVFSAPRLFAPIGSSRMDVDFVVAGSSTPAHVTGFGVVFADVERQHKTTLEYFNAAGKRLLEVAAPLRSDERGLSFVGVVFDDPIIARVRITTGDASIGLTTVDNVTVHGKGKKDDDRAVKVKGKKHDLVVMDDFLYGEPHAIDD
jgi:hypothetical protein